MHIAPTAIDTSLYALQLAEKVERIKVKFSTFFSGEIDVFPSPPKHYRMRAEFKIWHDESGAHYAMHVPGEKNNAYIVEQFDTGSPAICALMPRLLECLNSSSELRRKLFQVEFLSSRRGEMVITLVYHRPLDPAWQDVAEGLALRLGTSIIGRSRKQKIIIGSNYVTEQYRVAGQDFYYQQVEGAFTQPNAEVCEAMLNWAYKQSQHRQGDLLELYCGNGNFTLALAKNFTKVLATEISKTSTASALYNMAKNGIENIRIVRMSSEEISSAMRGEREYRRLKGINLSDYHFNTLLVDPPRGGLDETTLALARQFPAILYISCNPETLYNNIETLTSSHHVQNFALFDQFPYTHHIECGALLALKM